MDIHIDELSSKARARRVRQFVPQMLRCYLESLGRSRAWVTSSEICRYNDLPAPGGLCSMVVGGWLRDRAGHPVGDDGVQVLLVEEIRSGQSHRYLIRIKQKGKDRD